MFGIRGSSSKESVNTNTKQPDASSDQQPEARKDLPRDIPISSAAKPEAQMAQSSQAPETSKNMTTNGSLQSNGHSSGNGSRNGTSSPQSAFRMSSQPQRTPRNSGIFQPQSPGVSTLTGGQSMTRFQGSSVVSESASMIRVKAAQRLGAAASYDVFNTSFSDLVQWIRSERLTALPHKGSSWDKVLIHAQYFAEQVHGFDAAVQGFVNDSEAAAGLAYGHCRLLLELGRENASALEVAFGLFHNFGMALASLLKRTDLFAVSAEIRDSLSQACDRLLHLVADVALYFHQMVYHTKSSTVSLDFYETFSVTIERFRFYKEQAVTEMWRHQMMVEGIRGDKALDIKTIQGFLAPQDRVLAAAISQDNTSISIRDEFTCLWFQTHLVNFLRGKGNVLAIEGKSGSGKSTLASWVVDRLQRPVGRRSWRTLYHTIDANIPSQASYVAVVKSLLYQLLEQQIGDMRLYRILVQAHEQFYHSIDPKHQEQNLLAAFDQALVLCNENEEDLVMVVDGLDEVQPDTAAAQRLYARLRDSVKNHEHLSLITFSQALSGPSDGAIRFTITPDHTRDDIRAVVQQSLKGYHHFHDQSYPEQEKIIDRIVSTANGNFLWALLTTRLMRTETTHTAFVQALDTAEKSPKTINDVVGKLLIKKQPTQEQRYILAWLIAAERPLTIQELRVLIQVDVERSSVSDKHVDVQGVLDTLKPLLVIKDSLVHLCHGSIPQALLSVPESSRCALPKNGDTDLMTRMLIHSRRCFKQELEPSFDEPDMTLVDDMFNQHVFLEYAVRYWTLHFKRSHLFKPAGELDLPKDFKSIFPASPTFPALERATWTTQMSLPEAIELHVLALRIRRHCIPHDQLSILQTTMTCGIYYERLSDFPEASVYYALAMKISRSVLSINHVITTTCATYVLRVTDHLTTTKRTDVMTRREECLTILIESYKHQHGDTSEIYIQTQRLLAELYNHIHEEQRAKDVYQVIYDDTVKHHGEHSREATKASEHIHVTLKHEDQKEIETYSGSLFQSEEEEVLELRDIRRVTEIVLIAERYETSGKLALAEQTYVELWLRLTKYCHTHNTVDWHDQKIKVVLAYARFLVKQKRESEVSAILISIWQEYEYHELVMHETIMTRLLEVARMMRSVGLLTVSLSIFNYVWLWCKNTRKHDHANFRDIHKEIVSTSTEITRTVTTSTSSTTTSETILREVFESLLVGTAVVDSSTTELTKTLITIYVKEEKWSEAITVIKRMLEKTWPAFLSSSYAICTLPSKFTSEAIEFAEQLATCYHHQSRFDEYEATYVKLYRAVRSSRKIDDALVIRLSETLIKYYEMHDKLDKSIPLFQELLVEYRAHYGPKNAITIKTLYTLGTLCRRLNRTHSYWIEYYMEIAKVVNEGSDICQKEAMDAMIILANYYWEDKRYAESCNVYKVLWKTFLIKHKEYQQFQDTEFVKTVFHRYVKSLEEVKVEYAILRTTAIEYRETCIKAFGGSAVITIEATLELAKICERNEAYSHEAITHYEELMKHTSNTSIVARARQTLAVLYVRQLNSSTTTSSTNVDRAVDVISNRFQDTKKVHGSAHELTLTQLEELINLYRRQQKNELAVKELNSVCTEIISRETSSKRMVDAATSIATMYRTCGHTQQAMELVTEYQRQIIAKFTANAEKYGFNVSQCGRQSFVFLASLEYNLRTDMSISFSEILADLIAMSLYFEQYRQLIKISEKFEAVTTPAARLRRLLISRNRVELSSIVENELVQAFKIQEKAVIGGCSDASVRSFVVAILEHLSNGIQSKNFVHSVSIACNARLSMLVQQAKHQEAYELAQCTFSYLKAHNGYSTPADISSGFKLAIYMSGRKGTRCTNDALRAKMLSISRDTLTEVLRICKDNSINLVQMQLTELNDLIALMGEQQDYEKLEWLLSTLWSSREGQRTWKTSVSLALGRRLIEASFCAGHHSYAIRICEDIAYNLRRVHGAKHPSVLDMYALLSQLYTSTALYYQRQSATDKNAGELVKAYFRKAMNVHEDLLRSLVDSGSDADDNDLDGDLDESYGDEIVAMPRAQMVGYVKMHLQLLKFAFQRLGGWTKPYEEYERLNADVFHDFSSELKGEEGVEKWVSKGYGQGKADKDEGMFKAPQKWDLLEEEEEL